MNVLLMQIRREFWEHRVLIIAPLALCAFFLLMCLLAGTNLSTGWIEVRGFRLDSGQALPPGFTFILHMVFTTLLYLLMAIVTFFYLADCLYSERKDRSILFWKSLPVSDTTTVLAKLLVALIVVPLVVYVLSLVTNLLASIIFHVSYTSFDEPNRPRWTVLHWFRLNGVLFVDIFVLALWFAPVAAYQLLVSVWARRATFVWTVLPPIALMLGQWMLFRDTSIWRFVSYRLGGVMFGRGDGGEMGVESALRGVNAIPLLAQPDLWIGVAVAAALIYATIRIRRHSDDT